jgi:signal transduction histidine kinase
MNELTPLPLSTLGFRREVADRFGVLPNFFCSAAAPGLIEELWNFAKSAYLDSLLPSLFKERLFVHLSRFCEVRYCIVRHVGFLIGQGRPAGDATASIETVAQVIEMLRRPLPEGAALTMIFERLDGVSLGGKMPEPRSECETDLLDALTVMFLAPRNAARARTAIRAAVGAGTFEILVGYLAFIRTAHYWTEMHPELTYEPDMSEILSSHRELADLLLDTSEAEFIQGGVRLRATLQDLKRAEVALVESESRIMDQLRDDSARKDEFLAVLAHELRNPLAPIRTGLELIRRGGDSAVAIARVRAMMERQVGHLVRLVDDLLDVSRITSGRIALRREPKALGTLVYSAVECNLEVFSAKQITLKVELPPDPCVIDVDHTRFVQILSNLLQNAAKFTDHGGSVRVSAAIVPPASDALSQVLITVTDSGIGISPELLPRVFDLFTQGETRSSQPGLGIGLTLARRLVELHGGRLDARSEGPGRGSAFVIQLPLATDQSVAATPRPADLQRLERRILVVDDNHDVADATAMLIEEMGGQARVAYDGDSALAMLQEYQPEVILLDIGMRGLDGYETCQRIRRVVGNRVLVVALTGFGQEQDKEKASRAGFDAHLTKPTDGAALAGVLASHAAH